MRPAFPQSAADPEMDGKDKDSAVWPVIRRDSEAHYPQAPFHPDAEFPEYPFKGAVGQGNRVYRMVRSLLQDLQLDSRRSGSPEWNPLGDLIRPGDSVVVKPNLVLHRHPRGGDPVCLVTHGSVVRAVLDYVCLALKGEGNVVIADAPIQETDFDEAVRLSGIDRIADFYSRRSALNLKVLDLRRIRALKDPRGHVVEWRELPGDPAGYVTVDLGSDSQLSPLDGRTARFRVANYPVDETLRYHRPGSHRYVISRTVLAADVVISLPKLKTHCKAGITVALKNIVGIVGRKECLAHHRKGSLWVGGDEYPRPSPLKAFSDRLERAIDGNPHRWHRVLLGNLYRVNERLIRLLGDAALRDGSWYGNDTVWRMVLDLDRIVRYARPDGTMAERPQRRILTVVDGIVAGEGEGPLEPEPRTVGLVAGGLDLVALDLAAATVMGFDWRKIPLLRNAVTATRWPVGAVGENLNDGESLPVIWNGHRLQLRFLREQGVLGTFKAPRGWRGHVEWVPGT